MRQTFNIDEVHILTEIAGKRPCQDMCVFFFPRAWWLHIYCVCAAAEQYTIWLSMWMNYCQPFPPSSSQMQEITAKALYVLLSAERPPFTEISFFCFFLPWNDKKAISYFALGPVSGQRQRRQYRKNVNFKSAT